MIIYMRDPRAPDKYSPWGRHTTPYHKIMNDVKYCVINQGASIPAVIKAVINAADKKEKSIWNLILVAHGNSGWVQIGKGLTIAQAAHFSSLKIYMTPGGRGIEIHSCGTASDTPLAGGRGTAGTGVGYQLLAAIARAAGVPVSAGINSQYEDKYGYFEGPWITVQPNGIPLTNVRKL